MKQQSITFETIKLKGYKKFKCSCGRLLKCTKIFKQTLNPWNKNAIGVIKSRLEAFMELDAERHFWLNKIDECTHQGSQQQEYQL